MILRSMDHWYSRWRPHNSLDRPSDLQQSDARSSASQLDAAAKLSRPKLYSAIPRTRLFQRLDVARAHPGIWVCGPPGAGKTTLLASYMSERDIPGIWYQVDGGDRDPATFFYYLGVAADRAIKGKRKSLPLLTPEFEPDLAGFSRRYFRELFVLLPRGAVLVLDNVQEAPSDSGFQSVIEGLVDEIPDGINVIYISRTDPGGEFARHASTGKLAILEWVELRFTLEEARQIAALKQPISEATLARLLERCEGWAAGLTLMLERIARTGDIPEAIEAETQEAVFNYFAGTLFDKQPPDTRQVLLRTAFLTQITPSVAEKLTGSANAGKLLDYLSRRRLFTSRRRLVRPASSRTTRHVHDVEEATYEYHALFRQFLLAKVQEEYTRAGLRRLWEETANALEAIDRDEEAIPLYRDAEAWDAFTRLLLKQAANLLRQGRGQTLREWIACVPDRELNARPWISYWLGVSLIATHQLEAITQPERSFEQFKSIDEKLGQIACAARIVEAIYRAYVNDRSLPHWIEVLDALIGEDSDFADREVELRAHSSLILAISTCHPRHPRLRASVKRVSRLLDEGLPPDQMIMAGDALVRYFTWTVDFPCAHWVIGRVGALVEDKSVAPLARVYWWARVGDFYLHDGRIAAAEAALRKAEEAGIDFGSHTASLLLHFFWVGVRLAQHDLEDARCHVDSIARSVDPQRDWDRGLVQWSRALLVAHFGTMADAIAAARERAEGRALPHFFAETHASIQLAALLSQVDAGAELEILVDSTRAAIADTYMEHAQVDRLLVQAYAELRHGHRPRACAILQRAVSLNATTDFYILRLVPHVLSAILGFAVREGIGAGKVQSWIERYQIASDAGTPEHWPWPVKLYVLGGLRVVCRDQPVHFKRKPPRKPLELLSLLAAVGSGGMTSRAIVDRLWPDLEPDAALANVDTNVFRLRKLLGVEDAITSADGRVILNPLRCWVDAWSFERLASKCLQASGSALIAGAREAAAARAEQRARRYYKA